MNPIVLVTGASGFIGSHLVEYLLDKGIDVRAMTRYTSYPHLGNLRFLSKEKQEKIEWVRGDLKDPEFCQKAVAGCQYIFHLGALISIPYSYQNPTDVVQTNILGTTHLLNAARKEMSLKRFIHTSTSEVYGTAQTLPISEGHPLHPQSPYAASKVGADAVVNAYALSYDLPVTTIRPFNTYGPRQSTRAVIPTIISQLLEGEELKLGNLLPQRDFLYVKDTVRGFWEVGTHENANGETFNLGAGTAISIGDLYILLAKMMGRNPQIIQDQARLRPAQSEVMHLLASAQKAKDLTGWKAEVSLEDGLQATIDWMRSHHEPGTGYRR